MKVYAYTFGCIIVNCQLKNVLPTHI